MKDEGPRELFILHPSAFILYLTLSAIRGDNHRRCDQALLSQTP
jgi:hypothetical protein